MSLRIPTMSEIRRQVEVVLQRSGAARAIGIRSTARGQWQDHFSYNGEPFELAWCRSPLEIRERLASMGGNSLVIVTDLDDDAVGDDVLARLARGRLLQPDLWQALRQAFQARDLDPRLSQQEWIAEKLLQDAPAEGYPPVPSGFLDLDTVWQHILTRTLRLEEPRADVTTLVRWTLDESNILRLEGLTSQQQEAIRDYLAQAAGPAGGLVMAALQAGRGSDVLAIGLACETIFIDDSSVEQREAAVRLETVFGSHRIAPAAAQELAKAAKRVFQRLEPEDTHQHEARALELLSKLHVAHLAAASSVLSSGFEARLLQAASALDAALRVNCVPEREDAAAKVNALEDYKDTGSHHARVERAKMALRLLNWLSQQRSGGDNFEDAVIEYVANSSFVDQARASLAAGDSCSQIASTYSEISSAVRDCREQENRRFAELMAVWLREERNVSSICFVEDFISRILQTVAEKNLVLLIVFDGLSFAVWNRLIEYLLHDDWNLLRPEADQYPRTAMAALPTVTEVSRTSLLCGSIIKGSSSIEKKGFSTHPGLIKVSSAKHSPRLFHKGDLSEGPLLSKLFQASIANHNQRIVGAVFNAVDAQLSGSDQISVSWSTVELPLFKSMLREARDAKRVVVITSDHGHVVEAGTVQRARPGGDRWRPADGKKTRDEVQLQGRRVLPPVGDKPSIFALWSERTRNFNRRNGYHGGASPQEVLVPLAVLTSNQAIDGWVQTSLDKPAWWNLETRQQLQAEELAATAPQAKAGENLPLYSYSGA